MKLWNGFNLNRRESNGKLLLKSDILLGSKKGRNFFYPLTLILFVKLQLVPIESITTKQFLTNSSGLISGDLTCFPRTTTLINFVLHFRFSFSLKYSTNQGSLIIKGEAKQLDNYHWSTQSLLGACPRMRVDSVFWALLILVYIGLFVSFTTTLTHHSHCSFPQNIEVPIQSLYATQTMPYQDFTYKKEIIGCELNICREQALKNDWPSISSNLFSAQTFFLHFETKFHMKGVST